MTRILGGFIVALGLLAALLYWQLTKQLATIKLLERQQTVQQVALDGCNARLSNIEKDKASDRIIDTLLPDGLAEFGRKWLLPESSGPDPD